MQESIFLTKFAKKVYLIHRRNQLRATKILQERAFANEKIRFIWDSVPVRIEGVTGVEKLCLKNVKTGEESVLPVEGVFIFVGTRPVTEFLNDAVDLDDLGFIKVNRKQETSIPGVFAAGDTVRGASLVVHAIYHGRQAATAVDDWLGRGCTRRWHRCSTIAGCDCRERLMHISVVRLLSAIRWRWRA